LGILERGLVFLEVKFRCMHVGLGFRSWGLGFWVLGLSFGFGVESLGLRIFGEVGLDG